MCTLNPWCCGISQTGQTDSDSALCQGCTKLFSESLLSEFTSYKVVEPKLVSCRESPLRQRVTSTGSNRGRWAGIDG